MLAPWGVSRYGRDVLNILSEKYFLALPAPKEVSLFLSFHYVC